MTYLYLMENKKELTYQIIQQHVQYLRVLDEKGVLILCGPFQDFPGGIVIFMADNQIEAVKIAENDPFILSGCKTYKLHCLEIANAENGYLL